MYLFDEGGFVSTSGSVMSLVFVAYRIWYKTCRIWYSGNRSGYGYEHPRSSPGLRAVNPCEKAERGIYMAPRTKKNTPNDEVKHDLKTILTAISLKVQMAEKFLSKGSLPDSQVALTVKLLSGAQNEIRAMSSKIDEVL